MAVNVTQFALGTPAGLNVKASSLLALDTNGTVAGYGITTGPTPPLAGESASAYATRTGATFTGWGAQPTSWTAAASGTYTLYPWAKDSAGNVSLAGPTQSVAMAAVTSVSDNFNRANGAIGSNWVKAYTSATAPTISGNVALGDALWATDTFGMTQKARVKTNRFNPAISTVFGGAVIGMTTGVSNSGYSTVFTDWAGDPGDEFNDPIPGYNSVILRNGVTGADVQSVACPVTDAWVEIESTAAGNIVVRTSLDGATWTTRITHAGTVASGTRIGFSANQGTIDDFSGGVAT